jgi:hypothetical protein
VMRLDSRERGGLARSRIHLDRDARRDHVESTARKQGGKDGVRASGGAKNRRWRCELP